MKFRKFLALLILIPFSLFAQKGFQFENGRKSITVPFQLINNLIFIPLKVNGVQLTFLLDTGVEETILLSLEDQSEVSFNNVKKISLRGLGSEDAIEGLKSSNNVLSVNGFTDKKHDLYIVLDQNFNFSSHIGIPVNGIIGYHFFNGHLIMIDYDRRKLTIYQDNKRIRKKLERSFQNVPISIEKNKPYLTANVTINNKSEPHKLLLDLGNSDALWLFSTTFTGAVPEKNFDDYLGKGFSGDIFGKRARIAAVGIGDFEFANPIIAFPDAQSVKSVSMVQDRSGSIGGEIIKRFNVLVDYAGHMIYLRPGRMFTDAFHYNMSGIELQNEGMQWVQETVQMQTVFLENTYDETGKKSNFKYKFTLKPIYTVSSVRPESPAALCGIQKDDIIVSINNTPAYKYSLQSISTILKSEEGKWITMQIERGNQLFKFKFQLKSML